MNFFVVSTLALACALAVQDDELSKEDALLAKATARYEKGRYKEAVNVYKKIAKDFPGTAAGRLAEQRIQPSCFLGSTLIVDNGPSANRLDVALMGDGYMLNKQKGYDKLVDDVPGLFEKQHTYREYFRYFNFHRVNLISEEDGVDGNGRTAKTALNGHTVGTVQGHVNVDKALVREMMSKMPESDGLAIVYVKQGSLGMGGGGVATIGGRDAETTIHEFGHAFAHLGDEYTQKTSTRNSVRESPNVAGTDDPEKVPWAHWLEAKVPGVGVYQGANGQERGAWKPTASGCTMGSGERFCRPCREAVVLEVYRTVDPIDSVTPSTKDVITGSGPHEFTAQVLRPERHDLRIEWHVFAEADAPRIPEESTGRRSDRRSRGPLTEITTKPKQRNKGGKTGEVDFKLDTSKLDPGRHMVLCRVNDDTRLRGEKWPWVLKDEHDILRSERGWWVIVEGPGER